MRGRVQGVEPRPGRRLRLARPELRQHGRARRELVASRRVHRTEQTSAARRRRFRDGRRRARALTVVDGIRRL